MRKAQKKQIEEIIKLLDKLHSEIKKAMEMGKCQLVLALLEQAQDTAVQIGGLIEEVEGEGAPTVGLLENYCEQIYQIYELARQRQSVNIGKTYKNLRKELIEIENSVRNDIEVRTVAVFLPYKASMWDSLESVWQAADADPDCDAYVIPIPYFDKNPDGSFKEMHYEGDEYPDYVPITAWEKYDIVVEHPDIIFIHNPYDEFNHVTSVPPDYYAKNLKQHTDQLVYIPYYIIRDIEPDDQESVKKIEHFCTVPAVVYADKVIVQSKKMRQIYIDVMTKTMGTDTKKVWEKKVLGLGSPKIDRVLSTSKECQDIPDEWLKVIEKSDGSRKKIVFYNTSVSALLQHSEKMLEKIESVFDFFKYNQEDEALLWRPHPLIKATIESMRPQLWLEYEKLLERYKKEGWGIYDDTVDVDRAIAISDAYYGDPSSLVQMYEQTGKPIMIQDAEVISPNNGLGEEFGKGNILDRGKINLQYMTAVRANNKVYFSEAYFNGLFEIDINDFSTRFVCNFSGKRRENILLHECDAVQYKNRVYFFPLSGGQRVHYFDFVNEKEGSVVVPVSGEGEFSALGAIPCENKVWLFPLDVSQGVFVLDMDRQNITKDEILSGVMERYGKPEGFVKMPETGKVFIHCMDATLLLEVDLEKKQTEEHRVDIDHMDVSLIGYHEGLFYFTDKVLGDLYEWALDNSYLRKYTAGHLDLIKPDVAPFLRCCFANGDIYMIPWGSKYVMKIRRHDESMERAFEYPEDFRYIDNRRTDFSLGMMLFCEVVDNEIWFHPCGGNQLLIYNTVTGQITERKVSVDVDMALPCEGKLHESSSRPLDYFGYGIQRSQKSCTKAEEPCGNKIYRAVNE